MLTPDPTRAMRVCPRGLATAARTGRWRRAAAAALLLATQWAAAEGPCTLIVGQGRHPSGVAAEDDGWNRINATLATQVGTELAARKERTLLLTLPVSFDDVPRIVATVIENARREKCDRIVETSLFLVPDDDLIVARLRAYPLRPGAEVIGDPVHVSQREYPNSQRNRDRLQPAALGRDLAADYLRDPVSARSPR